MLLVIVISKRHLHVFWPLINGFLSGFQGHTLMLSQISLMHYKTLAVVCSNEDGFAGSISFFSGLVDQSSNRIQ